MADSRSAPSPGMVTAAVRGVRTGRRRSPHSRPRAPRCPSPTEPERPAALGGSRALRGPRRRLASSRRLRAPAGRAGLPGHHGAPTADRTGTIGVEAFDATYGAGAQASDDPPHAVECKLVEDGAAFVAHRPAAADRPRRVAFVDGTLRTEARLTRTDADADVSMGVGGVPGRAITRFEIPSGLGRAAAVEAAARAAGWLPGFASALHRDARAPVNLTPIAGLERHLHRLQGARLALRAVREAVLEATAKDGRHDRLTADQPAHRGQSATSHQRAVRARQPAPAALAGGRTGGAALESAPPASPATTSSSSPYPARRRTRRRTRVLSGNWSAPAPPSAACPRRRRRPASKGAGRRTAGTSASPSSSSRAGPTTRDVQLAGGWSRACALRGRRRRLAPTRARTLWTTPSGSPRPSRTCAPGSPAATASICSTVLLAEGINLGPRKMAEGTTTHRSPPHDRDDRPAADLKSSREQGDFSVWAIENADLPPDATT